MKYYIVRDKGGDYAKGKGQYGNTFRSSNSPPKLYSLGCAKQLQSSYKNGYKQDLEIIPVRLEFLA